jgi:hypothetical protein
VAASSPKATGEESRMDASDRMSAALNTLGDLAVGLAARPARKIGDAIRRTTAR